LTLQNEMEENQMENCIVTVDNLKEPNKLWTLENEFLNAVGEEAMEEAAKVRLAQAIREEKIIFLVASLNGQPIGMCSISPCFSTFVCKSCGVFDDFYIRPEYRGHGVARMIVNAAQLWCKEHDYASLTVGCARKDIAMYQSLGFDTELGTMLANNL